MILVTGATGNVGRHVVAGLRAAGRPVRTLSRRGGDFRGDLRDPPSLGPALDGVDAAFLLWPGPSGDGAEAAAELIAGQVRRIVIHERDIAEVAVRALTEDGHVGAGPPTSPRPSRRG